MVRMSPRTMSRPMANPRAGLVTTILSLLSISTLIPTASASASFFSPSIFDLDRPEGCPPCFNCNLEDAVCQQFSACSPANGRCSCPPGFGGVDCSEPLCGSLGRGLDRYPRDGSTCDCDPGWTGINCNVCADDNSCRAMLPDGAEPVCYRDGLVVKQNHQICDITNPKILSQLKERKPQATFSCDAASETCDFQFWVGQVESFYCSLDTCSWGVEQSPNRNTTTYTCEHIKCACIPGRMLCGESGSVDIGEFLDESIVGPATFQTISTDGGSSDDGSVFSEAAMNQLIQTFFGDRAITLKCRSGECLAKTEVPGYVRPVKPINTPLVAGLIAGCFLFFLAVVVFIWFLSRRDADLFRYKPIRSHDDDESHIDFDDQSDEIHDLPDNPTASVEFGNVSYTLGQKTVLSGVRGSVPAGQLLAIVGASGAGKTSLLDILARKNKSGSVEGDFFVNGHRIGDDKFADMIGFVDQIDALTPTLTVHETILDSALLRLPASMSREDKERRVEQVERELGIQDIRDQFIGSEETGRGISGGEKRRVSIACELVTSPSILFLDEPTSGLDSSNAYNVVDVLAKMARHSGRTIILSIHQPRSNIVTKFDRLILLARGRTVFSGPMDEVNRHFANIGYPCPQGYNIADFIVDTASGSSRPGSSKVSLTGPSSSSDDRSTTSSDGDDGDGGGQPAGPAAQSTVDYLVAKFTKSAISKDLVDEIMTLKSADDDPTASQPSLVVQARIGLLSQTRILARRTWRNLYRDPMLLLTHYAIAIVLAIFLGVLFYGLTDDIKGFQNRLGLFFFLLALFGFSTVTSLAVFSSERLIFSRERAKGYYHPIAYFIAKVGFDVVPLRLIPPLIMAAIIYPMTGLVPALPQFGRFVSFVVLFNLAASAVCLVIGVVVASQPVANLVAILVMLFSLLFSGFLLNRDTIPASIRWLQKASIFHYAFEGLIVNEVVSLSLVDHKYGLDIEVPGAAILSSFGFDTQGMPGDMAGLAVYAAVFVVLAYVALHFVLVERR